MRATSFDVLACASMDADFWTITLSFARRVLSVAMSTSMIRSFAVSMLLLVATMLSAAKARRDMDAPLPAHKVAKFWRACVNTPEE